MKILITRWQPLEHGGDIIASFNFRIGDIVTVRAALFSKRGDRYHITMPFTQHKQRDGNGLTAVGLGGDLYHAVTAAAEAYYRRQAADIGVAEAEDAGVRRVLCAGGREVLERAGI